MYVCRSAFALTLANDRVCNTGQLSIVPLLVSEAPLDEALAVLLYCFKCSDVSARGDLQNFGNSVSDLRLWKRFQESWVDDGMKRFVVST